LGTKTDSTQILHTNSGFITRHKTSLGITGSYKVKVTVCSTSAHANFEKCKHGLSEFRKF